MIKIFNIIVSGRVQNVGYRSWALSTAKDLNLSGWVKNLHNGNVELLIKGEEKQINTMIEKCAKGPSFARIDNIVVNELKNYDDFVENYFKIL